VCFAIRWIAQKIPAETPAAYRSGLIVRRQFSRARDAKPALEISIGRSEAPAVPRRQRVLAAEPKPSPQADRTPQAPMAVVQPHARLLRWKQRLMTPLEPAAQV
jgi:hypothetical protein